MSLSTNMPSILNDGAIYKSGRTANVPTENPTEIWPIHEDYQGWLDTPMNLAVTSTNSEDRPGYSGAHELLLHGLDENGHLISESVKIGSVTQNKFISCFTQEVIDSGGKSLYEANLGELRIITVEQYSKTVGYIAPMVGRSRMVQFQVPSNKYAELRSLTVYPDAKTILVEMFIQIPGRPWQVFISMDQFSGGVINSGNLLVPLQFPPLTKITATVTGAQYSNVTVNYAVQLRDV